MAELTPEQIKLEQERLELLQKQNEAVKDLTAAYTALGKLKKGLSDSDKEAINLAKVLTGISGDIEKSINKRLSGTATAKDLAKSLNQLENDRVLLANKSAAIDAKINTDRAAAYSKAVKAATDERTLKNEARSLEGRTNGLIAARNAAEASGNANAVNQLTRLIKTNEYNLKLKEQAIDKVVKEKDAQKELVKALDKEKEAHEQIKKQLDEEIVNGKEAIKQKKQEEIQNVLKKQFRVDEIKDMFTVAGLFKIMLDSAFKFNEISVQTGKSLGYGADQADRVATDLVDIAQHSSNLNVTLKNLGEAMGQLNTATGGVAEYSADTLETQVMLTKQLGLSGEEAAGIYKYSVLTGKSSAQVNDEMAGAFASTRNMTRGSADFKATMAEVAKVSGQLAINFKNNPAELTKAVVQAQALGTTLEKTKNQGRQLLDFESSIENELKAELLTGQSMNLERARAAALQGDQVTVMKELANQGMTINKFQNMNVLAQESYAKALGLTADELSDQLRKQKIAQEQGKSLAQINKEEALEAEKRQAIQDKFNAAMDKLKDVIGNLVAGPLAMFLDGLSGALTIIGYIVKPIQWIADFAGYIGTLFAGWADAIGPFGIALKVIAGIAIVIAAYGAFAALAWIPVVGPILGAAAAIAVLAKGFSALSGAKSAGDMMSPADGKTQVSTKEGGLFELSGNDDLVAYPGAADDAKNKGKGSKITTVNKDKDSEMAMLNKGESKGMAAPSIDLTPMINAINAVNASVYSVTAAVNKLYSKNQDIYIDGKKMGNTLTQNSTKTP